MITDTAPTAIYAFILLSSVLAKAAPTTFFAAILPPSVLTNTKDEK
jgi:hypothetical protein